MTAIGFGIIGAGAIASAHIAAIESLPGARLVGVTGGRRAPEVAARHGARHYPDTAALLADPAVDAVAVCTPSGAHMEAAVAAANAGKHVIVEKPLEVTVERARAIVDAARARGVKLATIFMSRFADGNVRLRRAVADGAFGRPIQADAYVKWWRTQAYYDSGAWRGTWQLDGGGALMNQAIHQVDLLLWLMGDVDEVFAYAGTYAHQDIEVEDALVAVLRFANGALGTITASTALWPGEPKRLALHGTLGGAVLRDDVVEAWRVQGEESGTAAGDPSAAATAAAAAKPTGGFSDPMAISFDNHRRQFQDFLEAIAHDRPPLVDGHEGLRSVRLVEAAYRSVRERRPVAVGSADS